MKLVMIIAGDEYVEEITSVLFNSGFMITEVGSSGDFLQYGYTVLMSGVEDEKVDCLLSVLENCKHNTNMETPFNKEASIYVLDMSEITKVNKVE
ncbi:MAG: cyclic-di-AMP receptor [Longicatena sp.]